jgi:hypothetical protein
LCIYFAFIQIKSFSVQVAAKLYAQGIGRLTRDEQIEQARLDLQAIVDLMGKNKFMLGDEPHNVRTGCIVALEKLE